MAKDKNNNKKPASDPVQEFLDGMLKAGGGYKAYYCAEHGKQLIQESYDPYCPHCNAEMQSEMQVVKQKQEQREEERPKTLRQKRLQRLSKLWNHLEE